MNEMASNKHCEDSTKSAAMDEKDKIMNEIRIDKKELTIILSVDKNNRLNDAVHQEENEIVESNVADESLNVKKKDKDNTGKETKCDSTSPIILKNDQDDGKADKKQDTEQKVGKREIRTLEMPLRSQNVNDRKDSHNEDSKDPLKGGPMLKRKRKNLNIPTMDSPAEESSTRSKRKKPKSVNDRFCWRCHKDSIDAHCTACPRSWHRKCIGGTPPSLQKWICGECATILRAENAETRSMAMAQLSVDQLCMLLKYVVETLRGYPGSEPFCKPVDLTEVPNYLDYVIKPMDLSLLESNVRSKLYGSTDAFMADAKWIQHNCIVFNTCGGVYADMSKLTNAAKQIIKVARQEVSEIEACPDCYSHGRNLPRPQPSWFIEPCRRPHPLVWAKLKGFPFWPAKAMPRVNSQGHVDVRFFGEHDRAWVAPKDLYLYSEDPPAPSPRKRKSDMDECVREITRHCRKLELMFGQFKFAPPKVQYNPNDPMQIMLILPNYNPLEPNNCLINSESSVLKKKTMSRKRSLPVKDKLQNDDSAVNNGDTNVSSKTNIGGNNYEKESEDTARNVRKLNNDDNIENSLSSQSNHSKLNKKMDQEVVIIAQNRIVREGTRRAKTSPIIKDGDARSSNAPNLDMTISDKSNTKNAKDEVKPTTRNLFKIAPSPVRETYELTRTQKRSLLKNNNPKREFSQNTENASKSILKCGTTYKPKTRMVDKLNAEKALKPISTSKENDKLTRPNTSTVFNKGISLLVNNAKESVSSKKIPEIDITSPSASSMNSLNRIEPRTASSTNLHVPAVHSTDKSVLVLVVNDETIKETTKQQVADYQGNKDASAAMQREAEARDNLLQRKGSKARKTFPNKSLGGPQVGQRSLPTNAIESQAPASSINLGTPSTYQLLPPEAGPISARLHHSAQELARRMGQLMEEAYKEAAQADGNSESGTSDNCQATVFFLRMQIEHMKWQHQQQLAELKHNADRTMREMRASLEAEKLRSIEEARREVEEDKARCIEETKRKQWCAKCGQEALFYCCWNTAYCDYPCQQSHWPSHMRTCSQQPAFTTIVTTTSSTTNANQQAQVMPRLVFNATSDVWRA